MIPCSPRAHQTPNSPIPRPWVAFNGHQGALSGVPGNNSHISSYALAPTARLRPAEAKHNPLKRMLVNRAVSGAGDLGVLEEGPWREHQTNRNRSGAEHGFQIWLRGHPAAIPLGGLGGAHTTT